MRNACTAAMRALRLLSLECEELAGGTLDAIPDMLDDVAELARRLDNAVTAALVRRDGERP